MTQSPSPNSPTPPHPPRVASWAAVSSKSQAADDKTSLDQQERAAKRFAESIGGHVVRNILLNDTYAGFPSWNGATCDAPSDKYPALWDPPTHTRIIRERARRAHSPRTKSSGSPVAGVAFCARCSHSMTRSHPRGRGAVTWLRCAKHAVKSQTGQPCHANYIKETAVIAALTAYLHTLVDPAAIAAALGEPAANDLQHQLERVQQRLDELSQQRERLALALAAGQMTPAIYHTTDLKLFHDHEQLQAQRQTLQHQLDAAPNPAHRRAAIAHLLPIFPAIIQTAAPAHVRTLLLNIGLRVECENNAVVDVYLSS